MSGEIDGSVVRRAPTYAMTAELDQQLELELWSPLCRLDGEVVFSVSQVTQVVSRTRDINIASPSENSPFRGKDSNAKIALSLSTAQQIRFNHYSLASSCACPSRPRHRYPVSLSDRSGSPLALVLPDFLLFRFQYLLVDRFRLSDGVLL